MSETEIVRAILELLQYKKVFAWRNNSGKHFVQGKSRGYMIQLGPTGSPDIVGILPDGRFLGIEVKKPGKKPTEAQNEFLGRIRNTNGVAFVATSIDDVESFFKKLSNEDSWR